MICALHRDLHGWFAGAMCDCVVFALHGARGCFFGDLGWFWAISGGFCDWCDVRGAIASGDTWTCLVVHGGGFGCFCILHRVCT